MNTKGKSIIFCVLGIIVLLLAVGGSFLLGQYYSDAKIPFITANYKNETDIEESEESSESTNATDSTESDINEESSYIADIYNVVEIPELNFSYEYPYGWHVIKYGWNADGNTEYNGYLYMEPNPINYSEGSVDYTMRGYEVGKISPNYSEQFYIDSLGKKMDLSLKVDGAFCYRLPNNETTPSGSIYYCVYDLGRADKKFILSLMDPTYLEEFQTIAESIEVR